ncbi:MAG: PLD nuclease N-terminal domain-containing protein, partial [Specibacter sp.]
MRYIPVIFGVVLFIYGLIDCLRSEPADIRSIPKPAWLLVIVLLPIVGVVLWFFFGRPQYAAAGPNPANRPVAGPRGPSPSARPTRFVAPDDDPAFLRDLDVN